jgi:hypothetical protein
VVLTDFIPNESAEKMGYTGCPVSNSKRENLDIFIVPQSNELSFFSDSRRQSRLLLYGLGLFIHIYEERKPLFDILVDGLFSDDLLTVNI